MEGIDVRSVREYLIRQSPSVHYTTTTTDGASWSNTFTNTTTAAEGWAIRNGSWYNSDFYRELFYSPCDWSRSDDEEALRIEEEIDTDGFRESMLELLDEIVSEDNA